MFGSHVKFTSSLAETMLDASLEGMKSIQIFLGSPYSTTRRQLTQDDLEQSSTLQNMNVFTHLPYVHNFAGVAKFNKFAHDGDEEVDNYVMKCAMSMMNEREQLSQLKGCRCKGCVLHLGSVGKQSDRDKGIQCAAKTINEVHRRCNMNLIKTDSPLLIETMVGRGGVLGTSFEQLSRLYSLIEEKDHVGFCIDTCHVFANGNYDLSKWSEVDRMFYEYDQHLPRNSLKLIHLNDSIGLLNSKEDKHTNLKTGAIWKDNDASLKLLLQHAKARDIPVVLETTEDDFQTLQAYM
jgi:deoxyribonuclease-4